MAETENEKYIKMTQTPEWKLVLQLALPTTISMLVSNIYNTADTFFVSKISVSASAATGIVFTLMAIFQAFGFTFGHGAGSNISRFLGAKKQEQASLFASTSFFLAIITGTLVGGLGLLFIEPLLRLLGSTETVLPDAKAYGVYILIAGPALTTGCVLNNILRYEGIATYAMIGLTSGGILNMVLDPVFIFLFNMGAAGAGLATALSQYISVVILMLPFLRGKTVTKISVRGITRSFADVSNIFLTGFPSMIRQGMNSVANAILNTSAAVYGDAAIAAFSIIQRFSGLLFSLALGLAQGFQPICAFNYGAKKYSRVRRAFGFTLLSGTAILCIFCAACAFGSESIIRLFRDEEVIVSIGSEALRRQCIGLVFLPLSALGSMLFQSTGKKGRAMLLAMFQSGLIFIPLLFILPRLFGLDGLEYAHPLSYIIAGLISLPIFSIYLRQMKGKDDLKA